MINEDPLRKLLPYIDAMNIDLKSMNESFYRKICGGSLEDVLRTIEISKQSCHIEITNLVIPTLNDSEEDLDDLIQLVVQFGVDTPLHFSRYFPHYKMSLPPTPISTLNHAWDKAKKSLRYVYVGNVYIEGASDTYCYHCSEVLIRRSGYSTQIVGLEKKKCKYCGTEVEIVL